MAETVSSTPLNDLLIEIGRSLLQYVSECWPWAPRGQEAVREALDRMAAEQRALAGKLARLLDDRGEIIDFGSYPTEYTSLHYVSVDFLLQRILRNQEALVRSSDSLARAAEADPECGPLLTEIADVNRKHLDELRRLAAGG